MTPMDWVTIGTLLAGVAAVATLIATIAGQLSAAVRYDLWVKVLNNARNEHQQEVAADRVDYYFIELAVAELTRRRRTQYVVAGFGAAAFSFIVIVFGAALARVDDAVAVWTGWVMVGIGTLGYLAGLGVAGWAPDRIRDEQRARTTEASAAAAMKAAPRRGWWPWSGAHD